MHIFILAGEPSGDEYGASLMHELLAVDSNIQFSGIGGPLLELQGLQSIAQKSAMHLDLVLLWNYVMHLQEFEMKKISGLSFLRVLALLLTEVMPFALAEIIVLEEREVI